VLFDAIERSLKRTSQQELISGLYLGERVFKVKCLACGSTFGATACTAVAARGEVTQASPPFLVCVEISERDEAFQDLTLTVKGKRSILDSLHDFSIAEKLEGSNQYECSSCEKMVDARRWESIRKIPPVLIISLARFEYDWERVRGMHTRALTHSLTRSLTHSLTHSRIAYAIDVGTTQQERQSPALPVGLGYGSFCRDGSS